MVCVNLNQEEAHGTVGLLTGTEGCLAWMSEPRLGFRFDSGFSKPLSLFVDSESVRLQQGLLGSVGYRASFLLPRIHGSSSEYRTLTHSLPPE